MNLQTFCFPMALCGALNLAATAADLKVGMIGLDTSHVVEFTRRLNDANDKEFIPGARVVVAFKGGSRSRIWDARALPGGGRGRDLPARDLLASDGCTHHSLVRGFKLWYDWHLCARSSTG